MFPAAPGQPLRIGAADYNAAVEAGREWLRTRRLGTGGRVSTPAIDHAVVWVRNSTSGALARGAVLELSTPLLSSVGPRRLWFDGIERGAASPVCAVLLDPAPQLGIVQAAIAGVVVADVDIQDADNTHARVESGSSVFVGDFGGPARIIYKPSGTGVKECVVLLGVSSQVRRKAVLDEDIAAGASGAVSVYIAGTDVGSVTAWFNWMESGVAELASGTEAEIEWFDDEQKWCIVAAECQA